MNEFNRYHPIVNLIYFIFAIAFSCIFLHPVTLFISLFSGIVFMAILKGAEKIKKNLFYMIPMFILMSLINPAFNHEGETVLIYLPGGNPLTFESIMYGLMSAVMIISVVILFVCFNEVMTSDKICYVFGKIIPSLSLIFSMTLRFVPLFINQMKNVAKTQKCVGRDVSNGSIIKRIKSGLSILSIMITWSLENAIETSDSMKSRGYGLSGRTAFSIFHFSKRDIKTIGLIIILATYVIIGRFLGEIFFKCFPSIQIAELSIYGISVLLAYFVLLFLPVIIEVSEVIKWKSIQSKI